MKKIILLLIAANSALSAFAQTAPNMKFEDKDLSRWVLDLNFLGGGYTQHMTEAKTAPNYLNGINVNTGTAGFKNGMAVGGDAQLGFFIGKNRHWGIGTGIMYLREGGDLTLNNFHAEYQSVDNNGYTFRQVVTASNVQERIKTDNFNIPLVLKYKNRFSKHWGFTADAGALFNFQMKNKYSTKANFDYEAIYKFVTNGDGTKTPVYETAVVPAGNDFLITRAQYVKNNPEGNVQDYFNIKGTQGYRVGLGVTPDSKTGSVSYNTGSVGVLLRPAVNYFFSDHVALNVGAYFLYQPFTNSGSDGYRLTNKPGDYSSVLNTASKVETYSYGGNVGLRFFLGNKAAPMHITSIEPNGPSMCGLCDGSVTLHGLEAGKPANVTYAVNGSAKNTYSSVVAADGTVKVPGLCAGSYTGIEATIGKKKADGAPVTLVDPPFRITSETSTNITAKDACDGTITLYGFHAGQHVAVTFNLNSIPQNMFETTAATDNSVILSGLCAGTYTSITVTSNKCSATLTTPSSITIAAPAPLPVRVPAPTKVVETVDVTNPILFNFNKSDIHESSYAELNDVARAMNEDKGMTLTIAGNTDAVGTLEYNQLLSERRAMAVKTYLTQKGVSPQRIKIAGYGETEPVATNSTSEGRTENRNATLHLADKK